MSNVALDRAHWPIWETYAEVSEEVRDLAYVLRIPILFKRWDNGWVIWNYKNFNRDRWNQVAEDNDAEDRHNRHLDSFSWRDNYSEEDYTQRDLANEATEYARYVVSYD